MKKFSRSKKNTGFVARTITAAILIIVGFILTLPFVIDMFVLGHEYHHITFWPFIFILGLMIGGPMLFGGIIALMVRNSRGGSSSTAEIDLGRIRYNIETNNGSKK